MWLLWRKGWELVRSMSPCAHGAYEFFEHYFHDCVYKCAFCYHCLLFN